MISKETAMDIALAYREVETAEKLLGEIIRLREKLGEPVCPHYAPAWTPSADTADDLPF